METKKVLIIGLGLIGGSIAKALNKCLNIKNIVALTRNIDSVNNAVQDGIIREGYTVPNKEMWNCDMIFLCTPVKYAYEYLDIIADKSKPGCIITDVCSTKTKILDYINSTHPSLRFIGGHPMAGSEKNKYVASSAHLFENAYYILTPTRYTDSETVNFMIELTKGIGAIPVVLNAKDHDFITAGISHVPHIIASALVNMVKNLDNNEGKMQMLAAGGFKDITRIASSNPEMWESIIMSNYAQINRILTNYISILDNFKYQINKQKSENVRKFFYTAKKFRDSFPAKTKGLIEPLYEIVVDVVDEPGIIGEIASLLGRHNINIKNINISNNREFEYGCLKMSLPDYETAANSYKLLSEHGYRVFMNK